MKTECVFLNMFVLVQPSVYSMSPLRCAFFSSMSSLFDYHFHIEQGLNWHKQMVKMTITF